MLTVWRLFKRLCIWAYTPTPEERLRWMYKLGKAQGIREALAELPIVRVQPRQETEPLHLPPGEWMRHYFKVHPDHRAPLPSSPLRIRLPPVEFVGDDTWLNSKPLKMQLPETTEEMPAVVKLLHERKYASRKLG